MSESEPNPSRRNISIEAARKMLGMIERNYSDEEIAEILNCLYTIAESVYEELD